MKTSHFEQFLSYAERFLALLRPKFYNRLTWIIVLAGLALMASPWWADLVNAVTGKYLDVRLPSSDTQTPWGFALVAIGLLYHLLAQYIIELIEVRRSGQSKSEQITHDRKIFEKFSNIAPEAMLRRVFSDLQNEHRIHTDQETMLYNATCHLLVPEQQFIDETLKEAASAFGRALVELRAWLGFNFFSLASNPGHTYLQPELNCDRAEDAVTADQALEYQEFARVLENKLDQTYSLYKELREKIKKILAV